MKLEGKVAVVTGGAQGIGRSYSLRFAQEGAAVAVLDLREDQARGVEAEIVERGGQAAALKADVTNEAEMDAAMKAVADRFGRIDVLMNNAAIYYDLEMGNQSIEYVKQVLDVNLFGTIIPSRAVFPYMKEQRSGVIVNIASIAAYNVVRRRGGQDIDTIPISGYGLAKSGVVYLTKTMANNLGRYNIRVNAIAPGVVMTDATKRVLQQGGIDALREQTALDSSLEPEDLTGTAVFLASDDSSKMTGQTLVVDAGNIMLG